MPTNAKRLNIDQISRSVKCGKIHYFDSIDSTNSWLLKHGQCGDICISETQSAGRGRRGNTWLSSNNGNIYFSICWCFDEMTEYWSLLGLVTAIAISEALNDIGLSGHGIKWPNDIFWNEKKLGGILLETTNQSGKVIIGIGLNISFSSDMSDEIEQEITSISEAMDYKDISRNHLVLHIIQRLQKKLSTFKSLDFDDFVKTWRVWDILQNRRVHFYHQGLKVSGKVVKIDRHGRLGLLKESGKLCFYSSADIKLTTLGDSR